MEEIPEENIKSFELKPENEDDKVFKFIIAGVGSYILILLALPFLSRSATSSLNRDSELEPVFNFEPEHKFFLMKQGTSIDTAKKPIFTFEILEALKTGQKITPKYSDKEWKAAIGSSNKFAFSSDGEKIACCLNDKDKSLAFISTATGKIFKSIKNAKCSHVSFTPDNKHVIYVQEGKSSISSIIVKAISDGLNEKEFKLQVCVPADSKFPQVLPENELIIYLEKLTDASNGAEDYAVISVNPRDPANSNKELLYERDIILSLSVSPDGKMVAFATSTGLSVLEIKKTAHKWHIPVAVKSFTWEKDSEHIFYLEMGKWEGKLDLKKVEIFSDSDPEVVAKNLDSSIVKIWNS